MNKLKRLISITAILIVFLSSVNTGECALITADSRLNQAQYWISKLAAANDVIMSPNEISDYNAEIRRAMPNTVFDLQDYPSVLTGQTLTGMLQAAALPEERVYAKGAPVSASFIDNLHRQVNIGGVKGYNEVGYGLTVMRTDVRTLPTGLGIFETVGDSEFDLFQETALNPAEPVVILHVSLDGKWYFVQTSNYRGWVPSTSVAVADSRQAWVEYINEKRLLVVTGNKVNALHDGSSNPLVFEMGARLPLVKSASDSNTSYLVKLPARDYAGRLYFKQGIVPSTADVSIGYLPYTRANIIKQAFKDYGMPYGWGGMHGSVDCSSLTMNVYRSFGFELPRNADQQEVKVGRTVQLVKDPSRRGAQLASLEPGATLHMNGHVMLYLGQDKGRFYVIHSLASYAEKQNNGSLRRVRPMKVVISDLDLVRGNGRTFAESLTVVKNIEW